MSTSYYVACRECVRTREPEVISHLVSAAPGGRYDPPHIHKSEDWEDDPDGRGMAHSSGWWKTPPEDLRQDLVLIDEYGRLWTVAEVRERNEK